MYQADPFHQTRESPASRGKSERIIFIIKKYVNGSFVLPGLGYNIALHALSAAGNDVFLISAFLVHSTLFSPVLLKFYM